MARVVVTGGAGFLGSHLADALLARGDEVVAVDNFVDRAPQQRRPTSPTTSGSRLVEHDVSEPLDGSTATVDAVMHFASPASPPDYLGVPGGDPRVGSDGTLTRLDLARPTAPGSCWRRPARSTATR